MPTRRQTLAIVGGGLIAAAAGAGYAVTRRPKTALKPWQMAGQYDDPRMRALSWAILAPNPHNMQPWKVDLSTPDAAVLYVDQDRLLPHTDPLNRQIVIGLGCFLETLKMAAASEGLGTQTALFPEGADADALDARPVAIIRFGGAAAPDPLFAHVPHRRTQKDAYDTARPIPAGVLTELTDTLRADLPGGLRIDATTDPDRVAEQRLLSAEAMRIEFVTPHTYKESVDVFRIGHREVDANPDGIDLSGPFFEAARLSGMFTRETALDTGSMVFNSGLDMATQNMMTAMGHIWITSAGNTRADQIAAGRAWMRLNLHTQRLGLGQQPLSQALQEYPEMSAHHAQAHKMLAQPGETVQMWARLGYAPQSPPSPRWPLEAKLLNA